MTFDIGGAVSDGWSKFTTETGAILAVLFLVLGLAMTVVYNSFQQVLYTQLEIMDTGGMGGTGPSAFTGFTGAGDSLPLAVLELPLFALGALLVAVWVAQTVVRIGAIRWFVEAAPTSSLDQSLFTRKLLWTIVNLIVGLVIYVVAVFIGALFFLIPGIFLAVTLFFYNFEIIVEGKNAIDALEGSWRKTKGDRLELFFLGFLMGILGLLVALPTFVLFIVAPTAQIVANTAISAVFGVFSLSVAAAAYKQVCGGQEPEPTEGQDFGTAGGQAV